jgi:hypothetical protein
LSLKEVTINVTKWLQINSMILVNYLFEQQPVIEF